MPKPVLVSGIQPSGRLHIGNYLGALKNFVDLQNSGKYQCYFFIADLHALTENPEPKELSKNILNLAADFLAAGLGHKKSIIFQQSQISAHPELAWILGTVAPVSELQRMTQFKAKILEQTRKTLLERVPRIAQEGVLDDGVDMNQVNASLFYYPILMAADILLYDAKFVPVGDDQLQHLELTRTLARKFNNKFGETFMEPQPILTKTTRIMSLDDPTKKMSKSRPAGCLFIDDSPNEIEKKIKQAVTDSGSEIKYDKDKKPAISNLLEIYSAISGGAIGSLEEKFSGKTYTEFKNNLAEIISNYFADFREKKNGLLSKSSDLKKIFNDGSAEATRVADKKMAGIKEKVGILP